MSYRVNTKPEPEKQRSTQKTTTPAKVYLTNGSTINVAYPCWYIDTKPAKRAEVHNEALHDHCGRPSPDRPGRACQPHLEKATFISNREGKVCRPSINLDRLIPVHLENEGYNAASVTFKGDKPLGLSATAEIDDWIIRVTFSAEVVAAIEEEQAYPFSVRITDGTRKDVAVVGTLVLQPAVI